MLGSKGINQVDFAIAVSVLIILFVFTVSTVSEYYSTPIQAIETSDLRTSAINLEETVFENEGVPSIWHWKNSTTRPSLGTTFWKVPVYIQEYNGTGGEYTVSVPIDPGTSNKLPRAWKGSVKAYSNGEPLPTDTTGETYSNGFLDSFDVLFDIQIGSNENRNVYIYYSQNNLTQANYSDLSEDDATVNVTVLSERKVPGVSSYKMKMLENLPLQEVKEKYDMERSFNVSLNSKNRTFSYGLSVPEETSTVSYSTKILYQNNSAHINVADVEATVW